MFDRASGLSVDALFYTGLIVWFSVGVVAYIYYQVAQTAGYGMAAVYVIGSPIALFVGCIILAFVILYTGYGALLLLALIAGGSDD